MKKFPKLLITAAVIYGLEQLALRTVFEDSVWLKLLGGLAFTGASALAVGCLNLLGVIRP